jgi:putative transport protein
MINWFFQTLKSYPEIAVFLSLALGYYFGSFTYKGLGLGAVTATLIAAVIIGQIGITISGPLKPFFFLMFLFAIGYGVGPQFVRGIAQDGLPQALFAAVVCVFCLLAPYLGAKIAGYDVGSAAGLYAGSQTISASMGLATDAINRLGLSPDDTKKLLDGMPVAYAVTYIFGTVGSALVLALLGPALLGIDLEAACKQYEEQHGGKKQVGGPGTAWHQFDLRAFRVRERGPAVGKTVQEAEALIPDQRVFILRIRQNGKITDATSDAVIHGGDIVAVAGRRDVLVRLIGDQAEEVDDRELLAVPIEGVDVYVTNKEVDGKTLEELATGPAARGVFLRKITRGAIATDIPILPGTQLNRGDIVTLVGRTPDVAAATKMLGRPDRVTDVADVAFIGAAVAVGALIGAFVYKIGSVPLTLSTSGGALISGLLGRHRYDGAADPGDVCRKIPVPLPRCHRARMLFGGANHDCFAWDDQRPRQESDTGTGLYGHLCGRQYAADDLGNGVGHAHDIEAAGRDADLSPTVSCPLSGARAVPGDRRRLLDRKFQDRHVQYRSGHGRAVRATSRTCPSPA